MPERDRHLAAAASTATLAASLETGRDGAEWVPTLIFYTAIHLVEAALAVEGIHPQGHTARANAIEDEWGDAASDLFESLRDLSEQWRYSGRPPTAEDVAAAKLWASQLIDAVGVAWPVDGYLTGV